MKTIKTLTLLLASFFVISSCEGPMGPPGEDGTSLLGSVFEIEGDFTASNQYQLFYDFPNNFEIYDTDVVLVYILWDVVNVNGKNTDVWRALPQTLVFDQGVLQYNFDYTVNDVRVFLETTMSPGELLPAETQDQVFRIAVLPADFVSMKSKSELNDMNLLLNAPEIKLNLVKR
jgi:hypothetical protein